MATILDIVLVGVFIALVALAAKKGFTLSVLEVVAIIAALFCASYISEPVSQGAYDTFLKGNIVKAINAQVDGKKVSDDIETVAFEAIPDYAIDFAKCAGIDTDKVQNSINSTVSQVVSSGKANELGDKIEETCIRPVAVPAIGIIMFFIFFIILLLVFRLLAKVISKSVKLPIIGSLDAVLGGFIGAVRGIVVLFIVSTVLVTMLSGGDSEFSVAVRESKVLEAINTINPFPEKLQSLF